MGIIDGHELGDVQAAILAADQAEVAKPHTVAPGERSQRLMPPGWQAVQTDGEALLDGPRRIKGTVKVRSATGFIEAIRQRWPEGIDPGEPREDRIGVALYADEQSMQLVCVLNDDVGNFAGWRDHRIQLDVKRTEEWQFWVAGQGFVEQDKFAEHIFNGAREIVTPSASDMLHIAEQFEATIGIDLRRGDRVRDGRQQFVYTETIEATAGGSIEVPEQMALQMRPFVGSKTFEVLAPIRYRIRGKSFTIGYTLERYHDVERLAFTQIADEVAATFGLPVIEGEPPAPRS